MSDKEAVPLAYTLGWIPFIHTEIHLDSKPLIPRPETEYWVDIVIKEIKESGIKEPKILDLCAGSGCIGVALLKEIPSAHVDFAEINEAHHKTIEKNIVVNGLNKTHTRIFGGDLFENIHDTYDFILSNPPYVDPALRNRVQESVLDHEPAQALFGGNGGVEIIERILNSAPKSLKESGVLYIEHEPEQVEFISSNPLYTSSEKDQYGVPRFSKFVKMSM